MAGAHLSIRARGQFSASPQLQQASRLLQVSTAELQQELRAAIASNPFLEEDDNDSMGSDRDSVTPSCEALADNYHSNTPATISRNTRTTEDVDDPIDRLCQPSGLHDHLRSQLCGAVATARERLAIELLIDSIDDDGYLRSAPMELAQLLDIDPPFSEEDLVAALRSLQSFDPPGVAARNAVECLLLQIQQGRPDAEGRELAIAIVRDHLLLLARRDFGELCRQLGCTNTELQYAVALIRGLDPHPGERHSGIQADYVIPDVIVTIENGRLKTSLNPAVLPRARVNSSYAAVLRQSRSRSYESLHQELREARWLMRNIEQRFVTIQRVAEAIVNNQRAFFTYGDVALRPMIMREVADGLALHESTISRAAGNKYMATPRGTFEFKHFFSRKLPTGTGGRCSTAAVRALIQEMLDGENPEAPLSDVELAQKLTDQGICIARRTVTKYRTMMKVPAVDLRKSG